MISVIITVKNNFEKSAIFFAQNNSAGVVFVARKKVGRKLEYPIQ